MPAALTPQTFVAKWRPIQLHERAMAQEHFIDLCRLLDHPTPAEADPSRTWFAFEAGATKATGGQGYADVWKRDFFAWEYKGGHADLDRAYGQLLLYSGALGNPPLLIVSDGQRFRIHTHFTHTVRVTYELTLDDLLQPAKLDLLRKAFTDPEALRSPVTTAQVTEQAATHFARIAQILRRYDHPAPAVAHFLIRLLFCLFAEDIGILPPDLFSRLVTRPGQNATTFMVQVRQLFAAMATGGFFGVETIKHVDGGLFNDDSVLLLDSDSLRILAEVCGLNWSAIEPAILGTLFERGLDPDKRSQLGAHFTAKDDILLVVEPVLMAPLRREWVEIQAQVRLLADQLGALDEAADAERTAAARQQRRGRTHRSPWQGAGAADRVPREARCRSDPRSPRAAAAISCTWRSGCCSTWRKRSSIWRRPWASRSACRSFRRRSSTASRSIPTPLSWPRPRSGSATSSGCETTALDCRPSRSSSR